MNIKSYFSAVDVAIASVFCALWAVLVLILGPLTRGIGVPVFHDFAVFFTLLLVIWTTGKFGTASFVGIAGSVIVIFVGAPPLNIVFLGAGIVFDIMMTASHHKLDLSPYGMSIASLATAVSAYIAGALIGLLFLNRALDWALTFWGGWHMIGGLITIAVTLPIIAALEKTNVRKTFSGQPRRA